MRLAGKGRRHALKEMAKASRHEMFAADVIELADTATHWKRCYVRPPRLLTASCASGSGRNRGVE